ncbi:DUF411 domain-containing protein [Paracoccus lutimaris]|uniref:Metal-binding protein n=1 Tax=Paracoccus lutimaris TaxID=1490030 RepID=A0A368YKL6_9RHOB|nr:DUF411 domain-containing protein [Paracoccus lutimaris]RCW79447.1 hypothetical protein DFP89_12531 [Paracoccus lutimaris]
MNIHLTGLAALFVALTGPALAQDRNMTVHKDPSCGCCTAWAELAEKAGYKVSVVESADIAASKAEAGVPEALWSCHTARIDGYVIEGHVPFDALARLLETRPDVLGIAVPGMPEGSPGMGDDPAARYEVIAWGNEAGDGTLFQKVGD